MAITPTPDLLRAIEQFKAGDPQAFEDLYQFSLPYLTKCVLTVVNRTAPGASEDLVQDILQDTYLSIAEKISTLQKPEAFFQWAGQIATNHALRTWNKTLDRQHMEQSEEASLYELADDAFIPEDILENKEKQQLIRKMLQELPTGQYLCLVEYFYNGLKEREIAEKLDMPLGTVKTNLFRAKKQLKDLVETHEKKHNVKLHSMSWLLLLLFMEDVKELLIDAGTSGATYNAVAAQLGGAAAGAAATAGAAAGATASAATAVTLTTKIVAGIVAAAVVIGGITIATQPKKDDPKDPLPTVHQTIPATTETIPKETIPEPATTGDVVLLPEDLEYINRVMNCIELGVVPTGPLVPYYKNGNNLNITPYVVNCAGTNGLLKGTKSNDGLLVKKADVEAFMMDTLGCVKEFVTDGTYGIREFDADTYVMKEYYGDRKQSIIIHNMSVIDGNTISVIALKDYTTYSCIFERSASSQYGWILTEATDCQEKQYTYMSPGIFTSGIVLPENGSPALDHMILTPDVAEAYIKQYLLDTTGSLPYQVVCERSLCIYLEYHVAFVCTYDESGSLLDSYAIGTADCKIYTYDLDPVEKDYSIIESDNGNKKEVFWKLGN